MFVVSNKSAWGLRAAGVPAAKLLVVHLGTNPSTYRPDPEAREVVRRELGVARGVRLILSTSHLRPGKGVDLLPEVAARLSRDPGDVAILVAGDGPLRSEIERQASRIGLDGSVFRLLGTREDIPRLLAAVDVFVLPTSGREGFGLSVLEAMSAGVPVVATDVADLSELLGVACRVVPPGDVEALSEACRDLLRDPVAARELGGEARRLVTERYSVETAARVYAEQYLRDR